MNMGRYVCRLWTKRGEEWTSEFEYCDSEKEAVEYGEAFADGRFSSNEDEDRDYDVFPAI